MFNLLKMDVRRLFKSRSFYIILGVTAGLILMVALMTAIVSDPETLDGMGAHGAEIDEIDRQMSEEIRNMTQLDLAHETLGGGFLLIIIGIGVTLFVSCDFTSGFVKNICCAQPGRANYVLSKALTAGIYSAIVTLLGMLLILLAPYLYGMRPVPNTVLEILQYLFWMWLPHWAFSLMALALVLLARSTTLGIILSLVAGGGLTAILVGTLGKLLRWPPLERYFLSSVVNGVYEPQSGITQAGVILACTIAWAVIYGTGSLLAMEKRDI
ncbi:MAG: hypothetical protein HFF18_11320 [Oscillospiraceae bacterium]|nr:hypothetical protein [Oscillospiraceae bacterium]